jgi:hypothetical protein
VRREDRKGLLRKSALGVSEGGSGRQNLRSGRRWWRGCRLVPWSVLEDRGSDVTV